MRHRDRFNMMPAEVVDAALPYNAPVEPRPLSKGLLPAGQTRRVERIRTLGQRGGNAFDKYENSTGGWFSDEESEVSPTLAEMPGQWIHLEAEPQDLGRTGFYF